MARAAEIEFKPQWKSLSGAQQGRIGQKSLHWIWKTESKLHRDLDLAWKG